MKNMRSVIETLMTDDGKGCFPSFAWFLYTVSLCYQFLSNIRTALYEKGIFRAKKMPCTVISIGNLVAGGTGKTPMTIYLAELVKKTVTDRLLSAGDTEAGLRKAVELCVTVRVF
ncbi:MAG: tetraacyldisaccharide 4'-kinase [Deltaproteobacteria bacterium]|nr:tetraacyldisaccharide 4'-kinase [Deltaproteobacteria bacterium]